MKKILIIYPHWHPVNLAGVHRPRLIGNYLKQFGYLPRVLTVKEQFFEEVPDYDFQKTFSNEFEVTRVDAKKIRKPRIIGDIGLRANNNLYKEAIKIINEENIAFIWLPIPSFYNALLGSKIYNATKVPFGIDYIDPWIRDIKNQNNWRAKISQVIAKILEPIALKNISLFSGVSSPYYSPAVKRNFPMQYDSLIKNGKVVLNPNTNQKLFHVAMPYGFDSNDHKIELQNLQLPWNPSANKKIWLYAGAFLPNSHFLLDLFFRVISELRSEKKWDSEIELHFIGTGKYPAKRITEYAKDHQLDDIVFEKRERYPFLHVLNFLNAADTVMIIGSTEKHYTASKTFQALLSARPVLSVFHKDSSAVKVMRDCEADSYTICYDPKDNEQDLVNKYKNSLLLRMENVKWSPNLTALDQYSAKESARKLAEAVDKVI